jgi:RNase P subunit RPR2
MNMIKIEYQCPVCGNHGCMIEADEDGDLLITCLECEDIEVYPMPYISAKSDNYKDA